METNSLQTSIEKFLGIMKGDSQFVTLSRSKTGITTWKIKISSIKKEKDLLLRKLLAIDRILLNYFYKQNLAVNDVLLSDPSTSEESIITVAIERGVKGGLAYDISMSGKPNDGTDILLEIKSISDIIEKQFDQEVGRDIQRKNIMMV